MKKRKIISLLETLPSELFHLILEYLELNELFILDQAVLNVTLRSLFLTSLHKISLDQIDQTDSIIEWILSRGIVVREIYCQGNSWETQLIQNSKSHCHTLIIDDSDIDLEFIGVCPALKKLSMLQFDEDFLTRFQNFLSINPTIKEIEIGQRHRGFEIDIASSLCCCSNLRSLQLQDLPWVDDEFVSQLLKGSLDLYSLDLWLTGITSASIPLLLDAFPNLCFFFFCQCDVTDDWIQHALWQVIPRAFQGTSSECHYLGIDCISAHLGEVIHDLSATYVIDRA